MKRLRTAIAVALVALASGAGIVQKAEARGSGSTGICSDLAFSPRGCFCTRGRTVAGCIVKDYGGWRYCEYFASCDVVQPLPGGWFGL